MKPRHLFVTAAVVGALGGGVAIAQAATGADQTAGPTAQPTGTARDGDQTDSNRDELVTGGDAERAREAAIRAAGGGQARAVEREDDGNARYEVEVATATGKVTDVELDDQFHVTAIDTEAGDDPGTESNDDTGETDDDMTEGHDGSED